VREEIGIEDEDIPEPLKITIFRIVQEAFHNIAKYSKAKLAGLAVCKVDGAIELTVEDDGTGFDVDGIVTNKGFGLTGMRERAELSGGHFEIRSTAGAGTLVRASWPIFSHSFLE
jgi:signal transduction histidine kinase